MHAKVITLHPDPDTGRFDDAELQGFLEGSPRLTQSRMDIVSGTSPACVR